MSIQSEINRINSAKAAIGAAIAEKGTTVPTGTKIDGLAALVAAITTGIDTSDATAAANKILSGYTAYVKGAKITGTIASQGAQTITPGTSDKTIASGKYLSGTQTIKGDANLKAENIAKGVSIFGVAGSLEAGGGSTKVEWISYTPANDITIDVRYATVELGETTITNPLLLGLWGNNSKTSCEIQVSLGMCFPNTREKGAGTYTYDTYAWANCNYADRNQGYFNSEYFNGLMVRDGKLLFNSGDAYEKIFKAGHTYYCVVVGE